VRVRVVLACVLERSYQMAPYGSVVLASYLTQRMPDDVSSEVFPIAHDQDVAQAAAGIAALRPDIVGLSCYVWNYHTTIDLARAVRRALPYATIAIGGPQVAPEDERLGVLVTDGFADQLVVGEGEEVLEAIVAAHGRRQVPARGIIRGREIADLSHLSSPYHNVPSLAAEVRQTGAAVIEGARGCPFSCTFCDQGWRRPRLRDLELVKRDLRLVYEMGARRVYFLEPTFNFHRLRLAELLSFIRRELPGLALSAEVKADLLGPADIEALSIGGMALEIGLQTIHEETLRRIKRPQEVSRIFAAVRCLTARGVWVALNTIYGLPGERIKDWCETLDQCFSETEAIVTSTCLKILPNTEIYATHLKYGYVYDEKDLFRALESSTMSRDDFSHADRLSKLLGFLQSDETPLSAAVRSVVHDRYRGSLAGFLRAFENGEFRLPYGLLPISAQTAAASPVLSSPS
jgi:radical SAM superfamily enzyme YgiQ (UPF0313 family)